MGLVASTVSLHGDLAVMPYPPWWTGWSNGNESESQTGECFLKWLGGCYGVCGLAGGRFVEVVVRTQRLLITYVAGSTVQPTVVLDVGRV